MGYSLKNRNVLVTAGSRGLGATIAEKFAAEGANVVINYVSSEDRAKETEAKINSQYAVKTAIVQGDLGIKEDCVRVVKTAIEVLGGLDIVISNAGWTKFANFADLDALDENDWDKCWAVNVKGHMHTFREALKTFNANPDGGAFIITASIAGMMPGGSSMPYSVTKAALLHLTKCLAKSQGPKVRVNAVCPGLLLTEWGSQFSEEYVKNHINQTALKRVAELDDTADLYISLAKNASITGQSLAVDGGYAIL
ncbi:short-chain dehydrogenase, putative [Talaromyces stipitatus ATCC 10500]|uniref:Short-chain dehydrogenase, putative n=1 Tax=Talaromyces stipitatus (strain ATCC 10500 / CBS 375.48 / QM 6759 / NRRL 1006) TaxID=441959 RepID=B8MQU4_TALSN|nr:short-chain dehydrogenase, putative [Talaromyces stipitatus ATCC 10500]EED12779.1 short-chain dehydrogenase, putative [Talaromyces stipitatus ATCC 10500]